jgi:hypothetical protein
MSVFRGKKYDHYNSILYIIHLLEKKTIHSLTIYTCMWRRYVGKNLKKMAFKNTESKAGYKNIGIVYKKHTV